jgi:hypothetical protein
MTTLARRLGDIVARDERDDRAKDFVNFAKYLMLANGSVFGAIALAKEKRALPRIVSVLEQKAAQSPGTSTGWASPLAAYDQIAEGFLSSLRTWGIFDQALAGGIKILPMRTQCAVMTAGATGSTIGEGQLKPISRLSLANAQLDPIKSVCIVTVSDELLKMGGAEGSRLLGDELSAAVSVESDRSFLAEITSGVTPIASSGNTAAAVFSDLEVALSQLTLSNRSRVFITASPDVIRFWSTTLTQGGAHQGLGITGGTLLGAQVVPSDGATSLVVFDATGLAGNGGSIELDASKEATMQMESLPDSPPLASTSIISLWPMNLVGLRATRYYAAERLGARSVAVISNPADSPA